MSDQVYHVPVLLHQAVEALDINSDGTYVDLTLGGGGHSRLISDKLSKNGKLISFDRDKEAIQNVVGDEKIVAVHADYRYMINYLRAMDALPVDGILADLGVSWHQFDQPERGFSFRFDEVLDMRMDKDQKLTAGDVVNTYEEQALVHMFRKYGELKNARKIGSQIVAKRKLNALGTSGELLNALEECAPKKGLKKWQAQVFQALRIEVNNELESVEAFLMQSVEAIKTGGRLVVISYHSLEDRLVKRFVQTGNFDNKQEKDMYGNLIAPFQPVVKKPIIPSDKEIEENPRARSAKMRIAERI